MKPQDLQAGDQVLLYPSGEYFTVRSSEFCPAGVFVVFSNDIEMLVTWEYPYEWIVSRNTAQGVRFL